VCVLIFLIVVLVILLLLDAYLLILISRWWKDVDDDQVKLTLFVLIITLFIGLLVFNKLDQFDKGELPKVQRRL